MALELISEEEVRGSLKFSADVESPTLPDEAVGLELVIESWGITIGRSTDGGVDSVYSQSGTTRNSSNVSGGSTTSLS